jgi:hypothetical protein
VSIAIRFVPGTWYDFLVQVRAHHGAERGNGAIAKSHQAFQLLQIEQRFRPALRWLRMNGDLRV